MNRSAVTGHTEVILHPKGNGSKDPQGQGQTSSSSTSQQQQQPRLLRTTATNGGQKTRTEAIEEGLDAQSRILLGIEPQETSNETHSDGGGGRNGIHNVRRVSHTLTQV